MRVVFRGGLEDNVSSESIEIQLKSIQGNTLKDLIKYIENNYINKGYSQFSTNSELEGGILCVINGIDWEILNGYDTILTDKDKIYFITTMHGG
ncbi:ubiquitin related modifier 1 [Nematocida sp. AWRm80]|nr:ubiquitin related modifier 1 [Nematocida sp. AWRm80]